MKNDSSTDKVLLICKVLGGEASEAERKDLGEWLAISKVNKDEFEDLKLLWEASGNANPRGRDEHFYDGLHKIKGRIKQERSKTRRRKKIVSWIALCVSVLISFSVFLFLCQPKDMGSEGELVFNDAHLAFVISSLKKEYNIHIEVENKALLTCRFTGIFFRADPAKHMVPLLAYSLGLGYEMLDDDKYRLSGSGCLSR